MLTVVVGLMEQEKDLTTVEAAVSKNNFVKKTVSVGVQQAIAAARQEQATKKTYYKPPRTTVLDELKFSVEGKGQATGKLKPFVRLCLPLYGVSYLTVHSHSLLPLTRRRPLPRDGPAPVLPLGPIQLATMHQR